MGRNGRKEWELDGKENQEGKKRGNWGERMMLRGKEEESEIKLNVKGKDRRKILEREGKRFKRRGGKDKGRVEELKVRRNVKERMERRKEESGRVWEGKGWECEDKRD